MPRRGKMADATEVMAGTRKDLQERIRTLSVQVRTWRNIAAIAAADPARGRGLIFQKMVKLYGYIGTLEDYEAEEKTLRAEAMEAALVCGASQHYDHQRDRSKAEVEKWIANLETALALARQDLAGDPTKPSLRLRDGA